MEKISVANAQQDTTTARRMPKRVYLQPNPAEVSLKLQTVPKFRRLGEILISDPGLERLTRSLQSTVRGRSVGLRSTFFAGKTLEDIAKETLAVATDGVESAYLKEFEEHWSKYTSPVSVQAPAQYRKESILAYSTPPTTELTDEQIAVACNLVWKFIGLSDLESSLRPLSLEEAVDRLPKNTSWGAPYFQRGVYRDKKRDSEADAIAKKEPGYDPQKWEYQAWIDMRPFYLEMARNLAENLDDELWAILYAMWYWRGDIGKPKDDPSQGTKQRDVWGYPHAISILESSIFNVLTDRLRGRPGFVAWTSVDNIVQKIATNLKKVADSDDLLMWAFDATGFDKHLAGKLIDGVSRNIVQRCFQAQYRPLIEKLSSYSQNCGIITPFGILCVNRRGNRPSGSGGTNLLDCLEQLVMFVCVMLFRLGYSEEVVLGSLAEVMGDDGSYIVPSSFAEKEVAKAYEELLGALVNATKEELSKDKTAYLKRIYEDPGFAGVASAVRTFLKSAQYERATPEEWNEYMEEIRVISSMENLKYHPRFVPLVHHAVRGARLGLGTRLEGGPRQLYANANYWAAAKGTSIKTLLDRDDWERPYTGSAVDDPSQSAVVAVLEKMMLEKVGS